jgi:hypothetical protein
MIRLNGRQSERVFGGRLLGSARVVWLVLQLPSRLLPGGQLDLGLFLHQRSRLSTHRRRNCDSTGVPSRRAGSSEVKPPCGAFGSRSGRPSPCGVLSPGGRPRASWKRRLSCWRPSLVLCSCRILSLAHGRNAWAALPVPLALWNGGPLEDEQRTAAGCFFICSLSGGYLVLKPSNEKGRPQGAAQVSGGNVDGESTFPSYGLRRPIMAMHEVSGLDRRPRQSRSLLHADMAYAQIPRLGSLHRME